jgi:ketosteroid isomerase-like protein
MTGPADDIAAVLSAVTELRRRVAVLEDRENILAVITRYGIAADIDDIDLAASYYTEDTVLDYGPAMTLRGRDGLREMLLGDVHQAHLPRCAHIAGPFDITVEADTAVATGYYRTYVREPAGNELWRLSYTRFEMQRAADSWQIKRRVSREVGEPGGQDVLRGVC